MNSFDKKIRDLAKEESREIPESTKQRIESVLDHLPEREKKRKTISPFASMVATAASIVFVFLFLLPNVSVAYASAAEKMPVIGKVIRVLTIRNYSYSEDGYQLDIRVPEVQENANAAENINQDTSALTDALVKRFYAELAETDGSGYGSLSLDYETITDTDRWFTLKLAVTEVAASSDSYYKYYHMDKTKDKVIALGDLFNDTSALHVIKLEIERQIKEQIKNDPSKSYFISDGEIGVDFTELDAMHNYYWAENGDLVIPFDKYEIAPGSMGTPEFRISKTLFNELLKPEYQNLTF